MPGLRYIDVTAIPAKMRHPGCNRVEMSGT